MMTHAAVHGTMSVAQLSQAHEKGAKLYNEIKRCDDQIADDRSSRELALVHTKLEEALMWLQKHNDNIERRIILKNTAREALGTDDE